VPQELQKGPQSGVIAAGRGAIAQSTTSETYAAHQILWSQILVVALIVLTTTWGATQWERWPHRR
jgi:hypothetical protein